MFGGFLMSWSKRMLSQFGLAVWALVTFSLAVATLLLYWQVVELGARNIRPATDENTVSNTPASTSAASVREAPEQRNVEIYCFDPETGALTPRIVAMEWTSTTALNCRRAIELLLQPPPADSGCQSPFPPETRVRGLYLLGKEEVVIDFSGDITRLGPAAGGSVLWENAMVSSLVKTLSSPNLVAGDGVSIRRVRILVDGSSPGNDFPAHLDLSNAIDVANQPDGTGMQP